MGIIYFLAILLLSGISIHGILFDFQLITSLIYGVLCVLWGISTAFLFQKREITFSTVSILSECFLLWILPETAGPFSHPVILYFWFTAGCCCFFYNKDKTIAKRINVSPAPLICCACALGFLFLHFTKNLAAADVTFVLLVCGTLIQIFFLKEILSHFHFKKIIWGFLVIQILLAIFWGRSYWRTAGKNDPAEITAPAAILQTWALAVLQSAETGKTVLLDKSCSALVEKFQHSGIIHSVSFINSSIPTANLSFASDYDIIFMTVNPSLNYHSVIKFCSAGFYQRIRQHLTDNGVFMLKMPSVKFFDDEILFSIMIFKAAASVFETVVPLPGEADILLCGGRNVSIQPEILEERRNILLHDNPDIPAGSFYVLIDQAENVRKISALKKAALQYADTDIHTFICFYLQQKDLIARHIMTFTGKTSTKNLFVMILMVVVFIVFRYFYSGGMERKSSWLAFENGLFLGFVLAWKFWLIHSSNMDLYLAAGGIFLFAAIGCRMQYYCADSIRVIHLLTIIGLFLVWICGAAYQDPTILMILLCIASLSFGCQAQYISGKDYACLSGLLTGLLLNCFFYLHGPSMTEALLVMAVLSRIPLLFAEKNTK